MLAFAKDLSIILAGLIALVTFATGALQYVKQGRQQRASQFLLMRRRFLEDPVFKDILGLLATDDPRLKDVPVQDRRNLVGFMEEVALLVDSRLLREGVAFYMFGYYVGLIDGSVHFWDGLDRGGVYWQVFRRFAARLKAHKPKFGSVETGL